MDTLDFNLNELLIGLNMLEVHATKDVLGKHSLRRTRYYILRALYEYPDLTLGQLSDKTFIFGASASRTVYSMEQAGLVQRKDDVNDRRIFTLSLTEKGQEFFLMVKNDLDADIEERYKTLDQSTKERLVADLEILQEALTTYLH